MQDLFKCHKLGTNIKLSNNNCTVASYSELQNNGIFTLEAIAI